MIRNSQKIRKIHKPIGRKAGIGILTMLLLIAGSGYLKAQHTSHVSFGLNYNFKQINVVKTSQVDQFEFNKEKSEDYIWTQEDIDDYNQAGYRYTIHQISADVFSGLTGSDSTRLRFGFGVAAGMFKFGERVFLEEDFVHNSNRSWNLFGEGLVYAQYRMTKNIYLTEKLTASYYSNDMNDVRIPQEDFDNTEHYTVTYSNSMTTKEFGTTTLIGYQWKNFDFLAGPQFMFYQSECDYSQHTVFNSNGDILIDNINYKTKNEYIIRLSTGINYRINSKFSSYLNVSFWKDIEIKLGIRI